MISTASDPSLPSKLLARNSCFLAVFNHVWEASCVADGLLSIYCRSSTYLSVGSFFKQLSMKSFIAFDDL